MLGFDARLWRIAGQTESANLLTALAEETTRHVRAMMGQTRKVLVVEPDGLLWNGNAGRCRSLRYKKFGLNTVAISQTRR